MFEVGIKKFIRIPEYLVFCYDFPFQKLEILERVEFKIEMFKKIAKSCPHSDPYLDNTIFFFLIPKETRRPFYYFGA
jgi:hypothetical protein